MEVALRVVKYLKGTMSLGLFYPKENDLIVYGHSDADWGNCMDSDKSLKGFCIFLRSFLKS